MNRRSSCLLAIIVLSVTVTTAQSATVAHWPIDEGAGIIAHDVSGNDNHGTIYGATWAGGGCNGSLFFAPSSDNTVVVSHDPSLAIAEGTIEMIFRPAGGHGPGGGWRYLLEKETSGLGLGDAEIYLNGVTGALEVATEDNLVEYFVSSDATTWEDRPYHMAYVFDAAGMRLYVDRVLQQDTNPYPASMTANVRELEFGGRTTPIHTVQSLGGWIHAVRISDVALGPDQFLECPPTPVAGTTWGRMKNLFR